MSEQHLRHLPSVDQMLRRAGLAELIRRAGRETAREGLREVLSELRRELRGVNGTAPAPDPERLADEAERRLRARLARRDQALTRRVVNATGVVLHTNLGRAPLSRAALAAITEVAADYCALEYDLGAGRRGQRGAGLEAVLRRMFNCEAAAVVNNCAAAVLLVLNTLAEGGEVIVSRGELIEIGGSFRIPEVIAKSGARLREVGTTNRTRLADYERAITAETRVILRAHPSNYRIVGFTERPAPADLARVAATHSLPLFEDLGSGCLIDLSAWGVGGEPTVGQALEAGASVVAFSGDKLLGGPQAGILLGRADLIGRVKSNPLMRALRADKLTFAALEATFGAYAGGRAAEELPALAALRATKAEITARARAFLRRARRVAGGLRFELIDGHSVVGGGSAPQAELPTTLISVTGARLGAAEIERRLRGQTPPVIARIVDERLVMDLRTVSREGEQELLAALGEIGSREGEQ